jgi:hypothetical protein
MTYKQWQEISQKAPYSFKLNNQNIQYTTKQQQLAAVQQNSDNIRYIHNPDRDVQLAAVQQDGYNIRFIHDPDRDVQLAAVQQDGNSIRYIHNPDKEVVLLYMSKCGVELDDPKTDLEPYLC